MLAVLKLCTYDMHNGKKIQRNENDGYNVHRVRVGLNMVLHTSVSNVWLTRKHATGLLIKFTCKSPFVQFHIY